VKRLQQQDEQSAASILQVALLGTTFVVAAIGVFVHPEEWTLLVRAMLLFSAGSIFVFFTGRFLSLFNAALLTISPIWLLAGRAACNTCIGSHLGDTVATLFAISFLGLVTLNQWKSVPKSLLLVVSAISVIGFLAMQVIKPKFCPACIATATLAYWTLSMGVLEVDSRLDTQGAKLIRVLQTVAFGSLLIGLVASSLKAFPNWEPHKRVLEGASANTIFRGDLEDGWFVVTDPNCEPCKDAKEWLPQALVDVKEVEFCGRESRQLCINREDAPLPTPTLLRIERGVVQEVHRGFEASTWASLLGTR